MQLAAVKSNNSDSSEAKEKHDVDKAEAKVEHGASWSYGQQLRLTHLHATAALITACMLSL